MGFLNNRKTAMAIMAILILFSSLTGTQRSLSSLQQKALRIFELGADGDGISIQNDLNERASLAYNMVTIGRKYLEEENALIQNVLAAIDALTEAEGPKEKYKANLTLDKAVTDLYHVLSQMELRDVDKPYPNRLYTDFNSRNDTISHDPYNQEAAAFNEVLETFPANVFSSIFGIRPLELFK